jgi:hypothetical protein
MSKTINNGRGANTLVNGLASLRFFASAQEFVSIFMVVMSFMMMLSSGIDLVIGVVVLIFFLGIILHLLHVSENLLEAIDSFKKYWGRAGKNSGKMFRLSYIFLIPILKDKKFKILLVVFFLSSFLIIFILLSVRGVGMAVIFLSAVLGLLLFILAAYHAGILTFLQSLRDTFEDSVFQLALMLIAVPFCTNLIPGLIGLFAWIIDQFIGQFISVRHVDLSISPFSVWGPIAGFFGANLVAWWLVGSEAGFLMEELEEGGESSGVIVESCGARGVV